MISSSQMSSCVAQTPTAPNVVWLVDTPFFPCILWFYRTVRCPSPGKCVALQVTPFMNGVVHRASKLAAGPLEGKG